MEKVMIFKNNLNYSLDGVIITKALDFESEDIKDLYIDFHLQGYINSSLKNTKWKADLEKRPTRSLVYSNASLTSFTIDIIEYNEEILNSNFAVSKTESGKYKFWWIISIERVGQQKSTLYEVSLLLDPYWTYGIKNLFNRHKEVLVKQAHIKEYQLLEGGEYARELLDIWSNSFINTNESFEFNESNYLLVEKENLISPFLPENPKLNGRQVITNSSVSWSYEDVTPIVMDLYYFWNNTILNGENKAFGNLNLHWRKEIFGNDQYGVSRVAVPWSIDTSKVGLAKEYPIGNVGNTVVEYNKYYYFKQPEGLTEYGYIGSNAYFIGSTPYYPQYSPNTCYKPPEGEKICGLYVMWDPFKAGNFIVENSPWLRVEDLMQDAQKVELSSTRIFINPFLTPQMLRSFYYYPVNCMIYTGDKPTKDNCKTRTVMPLWLMANAIQGHLTYQPKVFQHPTPNIWFNQLAPITWDQKQTTEESFYIVNNVQSEKFFKDPLINVNQFIMTNHPVDPIKMKLHPFTKYSLYTPAHNKMEIMRQFLNITDQNYLYFKKIAVLNPSNNFNYIIPYNINTDGTQHLYGYDNRYNLFLNDINTFIYPEDTNAYNQFMVANKSQLNQNFTNNLLGGILSGAGGILKTGLGGNLINKREGSSPFLSGTGITDLAGSGVDIYKSYANYHAQIQDLKRTPGQWESKGQDLLGNNYIKNQFACIFKQELMQPFKKIVKRLFMAHGYAIGGYYSVNSFLFGQHQRFFFNYLQALGVENVIKIPLSLDIKNAIGQAFMMGFEVRHIRAKMLKPNGDWKQWQVENTFNNYLLNNLDFDIMNRYN